MTDSAKHSPLPWTLEEAEPFVGKDRVAEILDADGNVVAELSLEDAVLAVSAVNATEFSDAEPQRDEYRQGTVRLSGHIKESELVDIDEPDEALRERVARIVHGAWADGYLCAMDPEKGVKRSAQLDRMLDFEALGEDRPCFDEDADRILALVRGGGRG